MNAALWLVNPAAGGGRAEGVWDRLVATNPELQNALVVRDSDPAVAAQKLDEHLERRTSGSQGKAIERVVAVGGDGTVHLAANRLLHLGLGHQIALGLIPAGTGSDLARSLGLPTQPKRALEILRTAKPQSLDALEVATSNGHRSYSINIASAGLSGQVNEKVNALSRKGSLAYLTATLSALRSYRAVSCRVEIDGKPWWQGPILLLAIANGRFFGKGMKVAPKAQLQDGLADIVLVKGMPRWRLLLQLPRVYLGTHLSSPFVAWARGREVRIEPLEPLPLFDLDGEAMASGPAQVRVLPDALHFLW
ncbi:MAG: diacylglycerol kinase family lipid kinase [Deltaproteobacteria bacterium]|nr:diacylglycerol kinase family lipid kinase [Deltaproteobacteria bacterium]